MKKLHILGVSAGQGALLFPFLNDKRYKILGNVESRGVFHTKGEEQWSINFPNIPFCKSFEGIDLENQRVDVIVSSPDCGASSVMRLSKVKELGKPENNKSLNLALEAIITYQPKVFLIENLPKLISLITPKFFEDILSDYTFIYHQRSVLDYGNSQASRKRLVIIGLKKTAKSSKKLFTNVFRVKEPKVTRNLLEVPQFKGKDDNFMPPLNKKLAMYDYRKLPDKDLLTVKQIRRLWRRDFKDEKKWPIKTDKMSTLPGVYRLEADKYPLTLRPADRQFRPDGYPLGIHDFKNIMGFPEEYRIYMDSDNYLYWLNKARYTLAKGVCYEVSLWFKVCLDNTFN